MRAKDVKPLIKTVYLEYTQNGCGVKTKDKTWSAQV